MLTRLRLLLVLGCLTQGQLPAQNLVSNPSFEMDPNQPPSWSFGSQGGKWEAFGHTGNRAISLSGAGDNAPYCRTVAGLAVLPDQTYVLRYWAMTTNALGTGAAAYLENIGGRRLLLSEGWAPYAVALVAPANPVFSRLTLSQHHVDGTQFFDDVEVMLSIPVHVRVGGHELGVGESFRTNQYRFESRYGDMSGGYARCLHQHMAGFSSSDWNGTYGIGPSGFVTYSHGLTGVLMTNALVKVTIAAGYEGDLIVEAGTNGLDWLEIVRGGISVIAPGVPFTALIPASLLPAGKLFVRLRATSGLYVSAYEFEAGVPAALPTADGATWFWEVTAPGNVAKPVAITNAPAGHVLTLALQNPNLQARELVIRCRAEGPAGPREAFTYLVVPALATNEMDLPLPNAGVGDNTAHIEIRDQATQAVLAGGSLHYMVTTLHDDSFGFRLPGAAGGDAWWCGSTYKVTRARAVPSTTSDAIQIYAARNEYEPFQIVLRPNSKLTNATATVSDFVAPQLPGRPVISRTNVQISIVEYVKVTRPTDFWGAAGEYPDPVVPLSGSFTAQERVNQPLWITVYVPKNASAGIYEATVNLEADGFSVTVPVRLRVFDFALSDVTHTWTAYHADIENQWHNLTNNDERQAVWELYLENFRRHRISPYAPHLYSPIGWAITNGQFTHDFTRFDAAMTRYLEEFNFAGFNLIGLKAPPLPTKLDGHAQFTPEYNELLKGLMQPMMAHLRERGWAELAYCYWKDEPQPNTFPLVRAGMNAVQNAAPGLPRALTTAPDSTLFGHVELWLPQFAIHRHFDTLRRQRERMVAGDSVGWYLCLAPVAPRPNNFIDHPAISHRIRFWMAERYGITNDLYWNTTWYQGPSNTQRNPWEDPMSMSGAVTFLGNGDGMLLYPPVKTPPEGLLIAGPINSLRWELLREGLEDGEYFWLLKEVIRRAELRIGPDHPSVVAGYEALNEVQKLAPSVSVFERNPERLQLARLNIATAIEDLAGGAPMIVNQPRSQAVALGESILLRVEALGWPLPAYQWRLAGTNLPGETSASLRLTNCGPAQLGEYTVFVHNTAGAATSAGARLAGLWPEPPQILTDPADQVRLMGERATLAGAAVGGQPLTYFWLREGKFVEAGPSNNPVLLLTNLAPSQAGDYRLVASNAAGVVTSAVARLTVLLPVTSLTLVPLWGSWRYHDLGQNLGTAWRELEYDDSGWSSGYSLFAYGEEFADTWLNETLKPNTVYFRQAFQLPDIGSLIGLSGQMARDDGVAIYLNGEEILRDNLPAGPLTFNTSADDWVGGAVESEFIPFTSATQVLQPGLNVIAVEVHQNTAGAPPDLLPVAKWTFEESGSLWSGGASGYEFVPVGEAIAAGPGKFGLGVSNSASATSYLQADDAPELRFSGPFTVGGWFRFGNGTSNPATCLEKTNEFRLYYTGTTVNRYRFELNGAVAQDETSGTAVGQWRFVVAWYDGTNVNIQVDNGPVYSAVAATPPTATTNPLVALKLSNHAGGFAADEMFFYRRVLSAGERGSRFQNLPETGPEEDDLSFNLGLTGTFGQKPQILASPSPLVRRVGENAAFTVNAASLTPLSYQWNFYGTPLVGRTDRLLFLRNVQPENAGGYSVSISNVAGVVTAEAARLAVVNIPELRGHVTGNGAGWQLDIPGSGVPVTILVSTNLTDWDEWLQLPASWEHSSVVDTVDFRAPFRFYRVRLDP